MISREIAPWHPAGSAIGGYGGRLNAVPATQQAEASTSPVANRESAPVKGYRMPAAHGQCGALWRQASDKPQGRKPRPSKGTVAPRAAMGI